MPMLNTKTMSITITLISIALAWILTAPTYIAGALLLIPILFIKPKKRPNHSSEEIYLLGMLITSPFVIILATIPTSIPPVFIMLGWTYASFISAETLGKKLRTLLPPPTPGLEHTFQLLLSHRYPSLEISPAVGKNGVLGLYTKDQNAGTDLLAIIEKFNKGRQWPDAWMLEKYERPSQPHGAYLAIGLKKSKGPTYTGRALSAHETLDALTCQKSM